MNEEKLKRFVADRAMYDAVYEVLLDTFIKTRAKVDVHALAAERLAINLLGDAWKELEKYKSSSSAKAERPAQPGL